MFLELSRPGPITIRVEPIVATWPEATMEIIASADHFLAGRANAAADTAAAWLSRD